MFVRACVQLTLMLTGIPTLTLTLNPHPHPYHYPRGLEYLQAEYPDIGYITLNPHPHPYHYPRGLEYLQAEYPDIDYITKCEIVWTGSGQGSKAAQAPVAPAVMQPAAVGHFNFNR